MTADDGSTELEYQPEAFSAAESLKDFFERVLDLAEQPDDERIGMFISNGMLTVAEGEIYCELSADVERQEFDRLRERAEWVAGTDLPSAGQFYLPLSPEIASEFLMCGARSKPEMEAQDTPTFSPPWTALAALEAAFRKGSSQAGLYSLLKAEIESTVGRFRDAYDSILKQAREAHEAALSEFKTPAD